MPQLLGVKHRRQEVRDGCLAACAQMALEAIGVRRTQKSLNRLLGLGEGGVPSPNIQRLSRLGVTVTYGSGDEQTIREAIDRGLPPVVFLLSGDLPYWHVSLRHAVLVIGYSNDDVFLNDPAFVDGPKQASWGNFLLAWSEFDFKYAILSK